MSRSTARLMALYPFCRLSGPANVLVMPAFHSASISTKMLQELGGATVIGPLLVGLDKPVQIRRCRRPPPTSPISRPSPPTTSIGDDQRALHSCADVNPQNSLQPSVDCGKPPYPTGHQARELDLTAATFNADRIAVRPAGALSYRADIDALRAMAILPVVLFHLGVPQLAGRFVGVDVFFVISGFLMAKLITAEVAAGRFSLLSFYERRVRRIFPALFAVLGASAVAAWFVFMPVELQYFGRSVISAALFGSNFLFWRESGYFDAPGEVKPLLHTWSLAVEEQFYILFPLFLLFLIRPGRRWTAAVLIGLLAASLALSIVQTEHAPKAAFYLLPSRLWELLLGAVLALDLRPAPTSTAVRGGLALTGIVLMGIAVLAFTESTPFPGLAALVPCAGAALIIFARAEHGFVGRFSAPPLVFVGLISYSLYLWHWPMIVFAKYALGRELGTGEACAVLAISLALAALSWRLIERPFRGRASPVGRRALAFSAGAALATAGLAGAVFVSFDGFPGRLTAEAQALYRASYDAGAFAGPTCSRSTATAAGHHLSIFVPVRCAGWATPMPRRASWFGAIRTPERWRPPSILPRKKSGAGVTSSEPADVRRCSISILRAAIGIDPPLQGGQCPVMDLLARHPLPYAFMIGFWPKYVHNAELPNEGTFFDPKQPMTLEDHSAGVAAALDATLRQLRQLGIRPVLVMDVPEMGYDVPHQLAKAAMLGSTRDIALAPAAVEQRQALSRAVLRQYAAKFGATLIDPVPAICDPDRCHVERTASCCTAMATI